MFQRCLNQQKQRKTLEKDYFIWSNICYLARCGTPLKSFFESAETFQNMSFGISIFLSNDFIYLSEC
jgi:hypothetical protein